MRGKVKGLQGALFRLGITPAHAGKSTVEHQNGLHSQDHPRVCGEKLAFPAFLAREMGSPPRMRGKDMDTLQTVHDSRITPAYAGKSVCPVLLVGVVGDHPRVCGEKKIN